MANLAEVRQQIEIPKSNVVVSEPLTPLSLFLLETTVDPDLSLAYKRGRAVELGGVLKDVDTGVVPNLFDGYIVGFNQATQKEIQKALIENLHRGIEVASRVRGIHPDDVFDNLSARTIPPSQAVIIDRVLRGTLHQMRVIGESGVNILGYQKWRVDHETKVWELTQQLNSSENSGEQSAIMNKLFDLESELNRKLAFYTSNYSEGGKKYRSVREDIAAKVDKVGSTLTIDRNTGTYSYPLPDIVDVSLASKTVAGDEDILRSIGAVTNPIVRLYLINKHRQTTGRETEV